MSPRINANLVIEALSSALKSRQVSPGLIFHSDRGSQYKSKRFKNILKSAAIRQSMSGKGNCYDNAAAESFFASLKKELIHRCRFERREAAKAAIFEYVEVFYNRLRLHSSIGYLTPVEFESK